MSDEIVMTTWGPSLTAVGIAEVLKREGCDLKEWTTGVGGDTAAHAEIEDPRIRATFYVRIDGSDPGLERAKTTRLWQLYPGLMLQYRARRAVFKSWAKRSPAMCHD